MRFKLLICISISIITGCNSYIGLAIHPSIDSPEYSATNPLGIVQVTEQITDDAQVFYQHISSIPETEEGYGLNMIGVMMRIK